MITESQYRTFMKEYSKNGGVISHAAMKAQMTHKTAARYLKVQAGPAAQRQARQPRNYRTREDPMVRLRPEVERYLDSTPELALVPKAFWEHLVATRPELAKDVPLRTFQRAMHQWRAHHGPPKEVFFPQAREPGRSVQYDWFSANELGITIAGQPFRHLLGHAVLPFSNWEWAVPCQSESSLSLRTGVQAGLWAFGGVPHELWTDNSCTATHTLERGKPGRDFNESYLEFCRHLRVTPHTINVAKPHEQGDVETAHRHLARRIQNHLLLRANRDFGSEAEYRVFLARICAVANQLRAPKVEEERRALRALPASRYPESDCHVVPVSSFSTVKVKQATYSVPSRLIGLRVQAFVSEQEVAFFYERTEVARFSRAQGQQARIDFRHIIAWLVRKPGAFRGYVHREELFPSLVYRQAYDRLKAADEARADRDYLELLALAADLGETPVALALGEALRDGEPPRVATVRTRLQSTATPQVAVFVPNLAAYDQLLADWEVSA
jgi:hypothetical protein